MKRILAVFAILLLCGCSTSTGRLSVIVPQGVQISSFGLNKSSVKPRVTGTDTMPILLFLPLGQPQFDKAVQNALLKGHGQLLTDVTVTDSTYWFILFGWNRIEVTGNVIDLQ